MRKFKAGSPKIPVITVSEEELQYRNDNELIWTTDIEDKVKCSRCLKDLSGNVRRGQKIPLHPILRVIFCYKCSSRYGDGNFSQDEDGDKYCRWCGEGGTIFLCSQCSCGFCPKCIKRHFGNEELQAVKESDDWRCYICNPKALWALRHIAILALQQIGSQKYGSRGSKNAVRSKPKSGAEEEDTQTVVDLKTCLCSFRGVLKFVQSSSEMFNLRTKKLVKWTRRVRDKKDFDKITRKINDLDAAIDLMHKVSKKAKKMLEECRTAVISVKKNETTTIDTKAMNSTQGDNLSAADLADEPVKRKVSKNTDKVVSAKDPNKMPKELHEGTDPVKENETTQIDTKVMNSKQDDNLFVADIANEPAEGKVSKNTDNVISAKDPNKMPKELHEGTDPVKENKTTPIDTNVMNSKQGDNLSVADIADEPAEGKVSKNTDNVASANEPNNMPMELDVSTDPVKENESIPIDTKVMNSKQGDNLSVADIADEPAEGKVSKNTDNVASANEPNNMPMELDVSTDPDKKHESDSSKGIGVFDSTAELGESKISIINSDSIASEIENVPSKNVAIANKGESPLNNTDDESKSSTTRISSVSSVNNDLKQFSKTSKNDSSCTDSDDDPKKTKRTVRSTVSTANDKQPRLAKLTKNVSNCSESDDELTTTTEKISSVSSVNNKFKRHSKHSIKTSDCSDSDSISILKKTTTDSDNESKTNKTTGNWKLPKQSKRDSSVSDSDEEKTKKKKRNRRSASVSPTNKKILKNTSFNADSTKGRKRNRRSTSGSSLRNSNLSNKDSSGSESDEEKTKKKKRNRRSASVSPTNKKILKNTSFNADSTKSRKRNRRSTSGSSLSNSNLSNKDSSGSESDEEKTKKKKRNRRSASVSPTNKKILKNTSFNADSTKSRKRNRRSTSGSSLSNSNLSNKDSNGSESDAESREPKSKCSTRCNMVDMSSPKKRDARSAYGRDVETENHPEVKELFVSAKESEYRKQNCERSISAYMNCVKCTKCSRNFGPDIKLERQVPLHPILKVIFCNACNNFYKDGEFSVDEDNEDKYCRWCGEGGTIFVCSSCPRGFCPKCIKRNLGAEVLKAVQESDDWNCLFCDTEPLWQLRHIAELANSSKSDNTVEKEILPYKEHDRKLSRPNKKALESLLLLRKKKEELKRKSRKGSDSTHIKKKLQRRELSKTEPAKSGSESEKEENRYRRLKSKNR